MLASVLINDLEQHLHQNPSVLVAIPVTACKRAGVETAGTRGVKDHGTVGYAETSANVTVSIRNV